MRALTRAYGEDDSRAVPSLLIAGPTGVGKTWQAFGESAAPPQAVSSSAGLPPARPTCTRCCGPPRLDSESEFQRWASVPLLLLDDLGAAKDSEWTEEVLYRLVNHRNAHLLPAIYTTNLPVRSRIAASRPSSQP